MAGPAGPPALVKEEFPIYSTGRRNGGEEMDTRPNQVKCVGFITNEMSGFKILRSHKTLIATLALKGAAG